MSTTNIDSHPSAERDESRDGSLGGASHGADVNGRVAFDSGHDERQGSVRGSRANTWRLVTDLAAKVGSYVVQQTRERPKLALGLALGTGFVLAGGLSTRAGRVALLSAVEYALFRRQAIASVADKLGGAARS